jgi:beta-lactam-binding protein with PASTA domain
MNEPNTDIKGFYIKNLIRLGVYLLLALALFFIAANLVFVFRTSEEKRIVIQDLTGKYYIDVHNDLMQSRLNVKLETKSIPEQPDGIVLHQSIPAGSLVEPRDRLNLVVNQIEPLITMPSLIGASLGSARLALDRLTYNEEVYSLRIAAVSYVQDTEVPPETVILQFPPAHESVSPKEPVYLLVSSPAAPASDQKPTTERDDPTANVKGQNISLAAEYLNRRGIDYRIKVIPRTPDRPNGTVAGVGAGPSGSLILSVMYREPHYRYRNGFERVSFDLDEDGKCEAFLEAGPTDEKKRIFLTERHQEDEEIDLIFFRIGQKKLTVLCGEEQVYSKTFTPDDLG